VTDATTAIEDQLRVTVNDGGRVLSWDLGPSLRGLTTAGLSRALAATAQWIDSLDDAGRAALAATAPGVQVAGCRRHDDRRSAR
jgi:hypothetical protein